MLWIVSGRSLPVAAQENLNIGLPAKFAGAVSDQSIRVGRAMYEKLGIQEDKPARPLTLLATLNFGARSILLH